MQNAVLIEEFIEVLEAFKTEILEEDIQDTWLESEKDFTWFIQKLNQMNKSGKTSISWDEVEKMFAFGVPEEITEAFEQVNKEIKMTKIINATPHAVNLLSGAEFALDPRTRSYKIASGEPKVRTFEPSGICPRCATVETEMSPVDGVPTIEVVYGEIENLPEAKDGVYYIVSAIVANAGREQGRTDLLIPARLVRDEAGRIIGCLALAR